EAHLPDRHPNRLSAYHNLGTVYIKAGRHADAELYLRKALDGRKAVLPERHPERLATIVYLGRALRSQGRNDEAIACFREVVGTTGQMPPSDPYRVLGRRLIADALVAQEKYAES